MTVVLDSKDLAQLDKQFARESLVWTVLGNGHQLSTADFVGANEVRVNKFSGLTASDYKRNEDNTRNKIDVSKETLKLTHERWMGYDLDALDESENASYDIANVMEEHTRSVNIPEKDLVAVQTLAANAGTTVEETPDTTNSLALYDQAEATLTDNEVVGQKIMFVSTEMYQALKNNDKVSRTFSTNLQTSLQGIDRTVATLDGITPVIQVPKGRFTTTDGKEINYIMTVVNVALPVEKYNDVTLVPASSDRDGYRDTIKGLDYYDLVIMDNAKAAIYVSVKAGSNPNPPSKVAVTGVTIAPATASVDVGKSTQLTATVTPDDATDKTVSYASSDDKTATVDKDGKVTGIKAGSATITVTTTDGAKTATSAITVNTPAPANVPVTGVTLTPATASVEVGATTQLTAKVAPDNATDASVAFTSSDATIATVDKSGKVTGVKAGSAKVTVTTTDGKKTADSAITVTAKPADPSSVSTKATNKSTNVSAK